jgi:membrane associated rhomboid family serine protease
MDQWMVGGKRNGKTKSFCKINSRYLEKLTRMFFPIGDDNVQQGHKPFWSYVLIGLNVLVFLYQFFLGEAKGNEFVFQHGAIPINIMQGKDLQNLLISMFMHGGWMHLIGNMLFLWVFADNIEATVGPKKFLVFYFLGGIVAGLVHCVLSPNSEVPCVGASGAISAVLGAYILMFPKSQIKVLVIYFMTTFRVPAMYFLGFWIVQQLFSGVGSLGLKAEGGTAYWAHIGGFAAGLIGGFLFKNQAKEMQVS